MDVLLYDLYNKKDSNGKLLYSTIDRKITNPYSIISSAAVLSPETRVLFPYNGEGALIQAELLPLPTYRFNPYRMEFSNNGGTSVLRLNVKTDNAKLFHQKSTRINIYKAIRLQ